MSDPSATQRAWSLLRDFAEAHNRHDELARTLGFRLGAGRGKVLFALRDGPLTLSEIAGLHGFDAPYATVVVDKLESHGLVVRRPHPDDRRRRLVALTTGGEQAVGTAEAILHRPPQALDALGPDELRSLRTLLERLVEADGGALDKDGHR